VVGAHADHDILEIVVARAGRQVLEADQELAAVRRHAGQDLGDATDNTPSVALMRTGGVPPLALAGVPPSGAMKERLSGRLP
jgi:hypothetical protein